MTVESIELLKSIPKDSILVDWMASNSLTEPPLSFTLLTGLSSIGACLSRNVWVDQVKWKIYANLSVLLVGPSGCGKDTAIDESEKIIDEVGTIAKIGGRTIETMFEQLFKLGDPAAAWVAAPELGAFIGKKDYQSSMVQDFTDLLSTKAYKDISTNSKGIRKITRPTLSIQAGTTQDWLHKSLPPDAMDGGFLPRFVIISEDYTKNKIPWIKFSNPKEDLREAKLAEERFFSNIKQIVNKFYGEYSGEIVPTNEAIDEYTNYYYNRSKYFSPLTQAYAHRSRDQVLRIALISAVCCSRNYISIEDVKFGIKVIEFVGSKLDGVIFPPTIEAQISNEIFKILPLTMNELSKILVPKFGSKNLTTTCQYLISSGQLKRDERGRYSRV